MREPTKRQIEVLRLIAYHIREHGFPPTQRELAGSLGIAPNAGPGIRDHLVALSRKRMISHAVQRSRGITLLPPAQSYVADLVRAPLKRPTIAVIEPTRCKRCGIESFAPDKPCFGCYLALSEQKPPAPRPRLRIAEAV